MTVETAVCDACGVGVRDESMFCYNCGEPVAAGSNGGGPTLETSADERVAVAEAERVETAPGLPGSKPPLTSAASLRKQRRVISREPIEISWERPAGLGTAFIITTIVLAAGALVLMLIAIYLR